MIKIDGSFGSGGGQILRTACGLSAVTKKPCSVFNIRQNRPKPGLMSQHLLGIQALAQLCNGRLEGDYLGSREIKFYPEKNYKDRLSIKIETAGSITLVLQTLIPASLFVPLPINPVRGYKNKEETKSPQASNGVKITFDGGATDTFFSPTIDYFRYVFLKILEKIGVKVEINILKRGYFPEGGAKVEVKVYPIERIKKKETHYFSHGKLMSFLRPLNLIEKGDFKKILIISGAASVLKEKKVAERQVTGVREVLGKLKLPTEENIEYYDTQCPGSQICLIAQFENTVIGTDNLGKLGKKAEDVGKEAALELLKEQKSEACLDNHLADQILPYMALAKGKSQATVSEITEHLKTNIWVIEKFLAGKFKIRENLISWFPS